MWRNLSSQNWAMLRSFTLFNNFPILLRFLGFCRVFFNVLICWFGYVFLYRFVFNNIPALCALYFLLLFCCLLAFCFLRPTVAFSSWQRLPSSLWLYICYFWLSFSPFFFFQPFAASWSFQFLLPTDLSPEQRITPNEDVFYVKDAQFINKFDLYHDEIKFIS